MTQKLYEISDKYAAVLEMVEDCEMTAEQVADTLESIDGEFEDKSKACAAQILNWEASAATLGDEIKKLQARKKAYENKASGLNHYLLEQMKRLNKVKIETPLFSIKLNKDKSKSVVVDMEQIDQQFIKVKTEYSADKKAIGDLLKKGEVVTGAHLEVKDTLTIGV